MTTSYSISDSLPRDQGGAKVAALMDLATSQNDWSMIAGIGTKIANGKNYSAMYSGNGLAGSKLETAVVGDLMMGALTLNPSGIAFGGAVPIRADDRGELLVSSLSSIATAYVGTSHYTVALASGILYRIVAATCGAIPGAQVRVLNGGTSLTHVSFSQNSETIIVDFGTGVCYASLITESTNAAPTYITAITKGYGIG